MGALILLLANFEVSHWKWKGKNRLVLRTCSTAWELLGEQYSHGVTPMLSSLDLRPLSNFCNNNHLQLSLSGL